MYELDVRPRPQINSYCQFCPRRYEECGGKAGACRSDGELSARILIVGMSPGEHELNNVPFVGKAGALLWGAGRSVGLTRADCRVMNVCNCWPTAKNGKDLSDKQIGACWDRFNKEMLESQAEVIICLGGDALTRITGLKKIDRYRGYLFSVEQLQKQEIPLPLIGEYKTSRRCEHCKDGVMLTPLVPMGCAACNGTGWKYRKGDERLLRSKMEVEPVLPPNCRWIIATYHPSYVMRMGRKPLRAFINDLDRGIRASKGELELKARAWSDAPCQINHNGLVAFDIENIGGLDGGIERIGIAGDTHTWTAPWNHLTREAARYELGNPDRIKVAHNIQHDLRHLEADGVEVPGRIFDTMWAGMVLEPDLPMGLRSMAPTWLDIHGCWKDESKESPAYYNAMDASITKDLAKALILRHQDLGSYEPLMKFVMPSLRVLLDMHRTGMNVDLAWMGGWHKRLSNRVHRIEKVWGEHAPDVDMASPLQVNKLLYGHCGMEPIKDPDNGFKPTTAAWALKLLTQRYPEHRGMLRCLLTYRKLEKLIDCCGIALGPDGAVHPHFGPLWKDEPSAGSKRKGATSTMRLAVGADGGLNMQQIPKFARRMYVPPPGFVFLEADLDRAEPWVYAVRSGDQTLINELENGDPYLRVAADAGCDRQTAKILFLARMYGAREKKGKIILAKQGVDASTQTISRVFGTMASLYSRCERYREKLGRDAVRSGRLMSGFGITRNFVGGEQDIPEAQDWEAQHHVAMILWTLFVPLQEMAKSFGGWLALTVYDSALLCVPEGAAAAASQAMLDIIRSERNEIAPGFRPKVSEVKRGTNWRDLR